MIFSVSIIGLHGTLDFQPDFVTLTEKDLVHEITKCSQEAALQSWNLLLSQWDFLDTPLARFPIKQNEHGALEMLSEVLSSVGLKEMGTSVFQVCDFEDNEFHLEYLNMNMDTVFRLGIDTHFPPSTFNGFKIDLMAENLILVDEMEKEKKSLLKTTTYEKPTQPPGLLRIPRFGKVPENIPHHVYGFLYQKQFHVYILI